MKSVLIYKQPTALKWDKFSFLAHSMSKEPLNYRNCACYFFLSAANRYRSLFMGESKHSRMLCENYEVKRQKSFFSKEKEELP